MMGLCLMEFKNLKKIGKVSLQQIWLDLMKEANSLELLIKKQTNKQQISQLLDSVPPFESKVAK